MDNAATDGMHADQTFSDKSPTKEPILRSFSNNRQRAGLTDGGSVHRPLAHPAGGKHACLAGLSSTGQPEGWDAMRTASGGVHTAGSGQAGSGQAGSGQAGSGEAGARADFEAFVKAAEPRLSRALAAAYGFEDGRDATAEALAGLKTEADVTTMTIRFAGIGQPQVIRAPADAIRVYGRG
jgi:hypothetical protein